jgi:hypothetical protein
MDPLYRRIQTRLAHTGFTRACPICNEESVRLHYLGFRRIVKERSSPDYVDSFLDDLVESNGSVNWCEAPSGSNCTFGSGSCKY